MATDMTDGEDQYGVAIERLASLSQWLGEHLRRVLVVNVGSDEPIGAWSLDGISRHVSYDPLSAGSGAGSRSAHAVAISAHGGEDELIVTRDPDRSSLLEPNWSVLSRHGGVADFEVVERRTVPTTTLGGVSTDHGTIDLLRVDAPGLEYQLISSGLVALTGAVCVEIVGGMVDNYVGQYPFTVVAPLLHGAGYSLVELTCSGRPPAEGSFSRHQPTDYRGVWLRDYVIQPEPFSFEQAVKLLVVCQRLGYGSFGRELSTQLHSRSLVSHELARTLRQERTWNQDWHCEIA
jgi:hypothetical protein